MNVRIELRDGSVVSGRYDAVFGWCLVEDWRPKLGDTLVVDGTEREVVTVIELPEGVSAIHMDPDFDPPG